MRADGSLDLGDPTTGTLFYKTAQALFRVVATLAFDLKVYGLERVPRTGGVLIVSNHQSYLDPPMLTLRLPRPAAFLAKSELFQGGLFDRAIRNVNAFPVRQGAGDMGAMRESIALLKHGWLLTVFAEGMRCYDGQIGPAQKGAGLMVRKAGVPVVPTVIDGAFDAWPREGAKLPKLKPIRVYHGHPVDLSHLKADDVRKWIDDTLPPMLDDLRAGRVP
ncbi:MAG: lysophospholipid acyltransferase family protein [Planctomycetota bacterium]